MRKLKVKKPYKSLEDIYLKESFAKPIPFLPRQIFERVTINVTTERGEKENFTVSDSWYNKAIKDKLKMGSQNQDTFYELIHYRCVDAGILPQGHQDINSEKVKVFYDYIISITGADKINAFFEKFVDQGMSMSGAFLQAINTSEKFNFLEMLSNFYGVKFIYSEEVFEVRPYIAAKRTRGAPGPGEAFIAFFFYSKKPVVGDLSIPSGGRTVEIEIKKQEGRIGKSLSKEAGMFGRRLFPSLSVLDQNVLNDFIQKFNLKTVKDLLLGTGEGKFPGITGVNKYINEAADSNFLKQDLNYFVQNFSDLNYLQQYIGVIQMKDYFSKIKEFDSILVFDINGFAIGFKREFVLNNDLFSVAQAMLQKQVLLKRKTSKNTLFDADGFLIVLAKQAGSGVGKRAVRKQAPKQQKPSEFTPPERPPAANTQTQQPGSQQQASQQPL